MQGVFFRDSARREARSAGVSGWISNRSDGAVEAVFEGESHAVERLIAFCRAGPPDAVVERVEETVEQPLGGSGFEVR